MASSVVEIFNLACSIMPRVPSVQSQTENTRHAVALNTVYDSVRRKAIRKHPWNGCMKRAILSRHGTTPAFRFSYYYELPSGCLRVMDVFDSDGVRISEEWKVELIGTGDSEELVLATDSTEAYIEYISDVTNPGFFRAGLDHVIANELAKRVAPSLGVSLGDIRYLKTVSDEEEIEAKGDDGQEGSDDEIESDIYIRARYGGAS